MGLGAVEEKGLFLTTAGGYIWNRKASEDDPNYGTQEWTNKKGEINIRKGAKYSDISGNVVDVVFKTHKEYGENINVYIEDNGETYIFSISTNTKYSQNMMKCLLMMDLQKELFIKPYDFKDDNGKRQQGLSFRQDGEKMDLKKFEIPDEWERGKEFWLPSNKKKFIRYLEDFSDWLVSEVEEKIAPKLANLKSKKAINESSNEVVEEDKSNQDAPKDEVKEKISPIKMRKHLKAYIAENYDSGEQLPKLSKDDLIKWYELSLQDEELPFDELGESKEVEKKEILDSDVEVSQEDLDEQLEALMG